MDSSHSSIVRFQRKGYVVVASVHATNMLDAVTVTDFGNEVVEHVQRLPHVHLILNFERVEFLTSGALSEIIRIQDAVKRVGGELRLWGVSNDIKKVFKITKLDKLLSIMDGLSLQEAVNKLSRAADLKSQDEKWAEKERNRS